MLAARILEVLFHPTKGRLELVTFVPTKDEVARSHPLMLPRQRSWSADLRAFVRRRDRKYGVIPDGQFVRRYVHVRKSALVGFGREGAKLTTHMKLGATAAADPSVFIDWKSRLLAMGRTWAGRVGLLWPFVTRTKAKLKEGMPLPNGVAARRLKRTLLTAR